jgi:hypothetical protein
MMADPNVTLWTQIPHTAWPKKCPRCGSGLSNTSYEPYCSDADCRWNADGSPVAVTLVEAALALLDHAAPRGEPQALIWQFSIHGHDCWTECSEDFARRAMKEDPFLVRALRVVPIPPGAKGLGDAQD